MRYTKAIIRALSDKMAFRQAMFNTTNLDKCQVGENGSLEYTNAGVESNVLALSQMVRGGDPRDLVDQIVAKGSTQDLVDLVVLVFAARNTRGGKGEKKLAYVMFLRLYNKAIPGTALALLKLFPHYGYWKDLLQLIKMIKENPAVSKTMKDAFFDTAVKVMADQLVIDMNHLRQSKETTESKPAQISLLAKWLPRENSSLDKSTAVVDALASALFSSVSAGANDGSWQSKSKRMYRKVLSELTAQLALPEVLLAAHREEEIEFGRIASRATMNLRRVFMNQDKHGQLRSKDPKRKDMAERFIEHVVTKGLKGAQIMPHEIVKKIMYQGVVSETEELILDAQWKALRESVVEQIEAALEEGDSLSRLVPLSDVSGSMSGIPMEVSIALGILLSEITHPAFRHMVLTFESKPRWHLLNQSDTIVQKVKSLQRAPWGGSTDFAAAYRLILKQARENKLDRSDMPAMIVFSDMQFDIAQGHYNGGFSVNTRDNMMQDLIKKEFENTASALGWEDPTPTPLVYWNLRNTGGHPVNCETQGAVLLSGFSPSMLKLVMTGKALEAVEVELVDENGETTITKVQVTPQEVLRKMLDDELYDPVRRILATSQEGPLKGWGRESMESQLIDGSSFEVV